MNHRQLSILNSLVTFAAEHIPGGLSPDERNVAQLVGSWALECRTHEYRVVNASHHPSTSIACNEWAGQCWRVVTVIPAKGPGYADELVLERPVYSSAEIPEMLQRIFDAADGALPNDAGRLLNMIEAVHQEIEERR